MEKKEILEAIRGNLKEIKSGMLCMEKDIAHISACIKNQQFIPVDISQNMIDVLKNVKEARDDCKEQYEQLSDDPFEFQKIEDFESVLSVIEEEARREDFIQTTQLFLKLHAKDEHIQELLVSEQIKLVELLPEADDTDEALSKIRPYYDFVQLVIGKDSTSSASIVESIVNLRVNFGDGLIGEAFCKNNIYIKTEEDTKGEPLKELSRINGGGKNADSLETLEEKAALQSEGQIAGHLGESQAKVTSQASEEQITGQLEGVEPGVALHAEEDDDADLLEGVEPGVALHAEGDDDADLLEESQTEGFLQAYEGEAITGEESFGQPGTLQDAKEAETEQMEGSSQEMGSAQDTEEEEEQAEELNEEFPKIVQELLDAQAILPDTYNYGELKIYKGEREGKKFGANIFKNDLKSGHMKLEKKIFVFARKYDAIAENFIFAFTDIPKEMVNYAFEHLIKKGYLRRYSILGIGSFCCVTPKGEHAFSSKEACAFLGVKRSGHNQNVEVVEDTIQAVATRIAYAKMLGLDFKIRGAIGFSIQKLLYTESFLLGIENLKQESDLFVGCFWGQLDECDKFDKELKDSLQELKKVSRIIFVGMDVSHVSAVAEVFIARYEEFMPEERYLYALKDDSFYSWEDGQELEVQDIWRFQEEGEKEGQETFEKESEMKAVLQTEGEKKAVSETGDEKKIGLEIEFKSETNDRLGAVPEAELEEGEKWKDGLKDVEKLEEDQVFQPVIGMENILQEAYKMIVGGRTYCAAAYLKANTTIIDGIDMVYDKLAYAVNEPSRSCSYSSDEIFDVFLDDSSLFYDYLMISAALRTFFYNHSEFDYSMKALYENMKNLPTVTLIPELSNFMYFLIDFKEQEHKGIDVYADYRMKDKILLENTIIRIQREAEGFYEKNVRGHFSEKASHKRFMETMKLIFSQDNDIAVYLNYIVEGDNSVLELMKEYLAENFMKDESPVDVVNIDRSKIEAYIDDNWDKAREKMRVAKKTSDLMGSFRQNLYNSLHTAITTMCDWVKYVECLERSGEDAGFEHYKKVRNTLLNDIDVLVGFYSRQKTENWEEKAGIKILTDTLVELKARLNGSYNENEQKYFYIDFLKSDIVLLDENYFPVFDKNFHDIPELAVTSRILYHSKQKFAGLEERLHDIFEKSGDDFGSAQLIDQYFADVTGQSALEGKWDLNESISFAKRRAEKNKNDFVENLELAQSYGQIDNSMENRKEKILQIVNEFYEHANDTDNYGFFLKVTKAYMSQIKKDAKVREEPLKRELELYKKEMPEENPEITKRFEKIEKMLEVQNYTVAEDLLSRLKNGEPEGELEIFETDYLRKFMDEYDYYCRMVLNSSRTMSSLVPSRLRNKEGRGGQRLVDNWISNGQTTEKVKNLLQALGFSVLEVKEQAKIGKFENYNVMLMKPQNGKKANFKHPIAALGSRAVENGFRVVCLYGIYDANRIIEVIKELGNAKNTMIFLDCALTIQDRRSLARKVKSDVQDKLFGIIDRVLLMFLINHYNEEYINKMLMCIMMPFAYYQPYVWESSNEIPPEIFMGRKEELEKIESPGGVHIVYGGRQLGKSALLRRAKNDIDRNENGDRAVLVVIKDKDYKKTASAIGEALYFAGILKYDPQTEDWDELARVIKKRLLLDTEEKIPYLLLLLDEADAFIESCEEVGYHPFDALEDIQGIGSGRFKFVIAGLRNIIRFDRDHTLNSNKGLTHFASMTVKPFQVQEARELLEVPLYYLGLRFPADKESLISLIFASANYFPGLIQLYCAKLVEAMRKGDYAGYDERNTPPYEVQESHIKKVLADKGFMEQIREKFDITLRLDDDDYYHIIALLVAHLYHQNGYMSGYTSEEVHEEGRSLGIYKIEELSLNKLTALMEELCELNVLRKTSDEKYLFNQYRFHQMMGSCQEVDDKLMEYMGE